MNKDKNLLNGKGEDDISWITVNGAHIPIKDGEDKAAAIKKHFEYSAEKKDAVKHLTETLKKVAESKYKLSKPKMADLVKKIMNFEPVILKIDNKDTLVEFDAFGARKIIYGKSGSKKLKENAREKTVKLKSIDNLPEYIRTSTYQNSDVESGKNGKAHKGVIKWHYLINQVSINNKKYNIHIDVRDKGKQKFVYFVTFKKEREQ